MIHRTDCRRRGDEGCGPTSIGTYRREGGHFPSDLTDAVWARLEPLIPSAKPGGRPRKTDMRAAMNAIVCCEPAALGATCRATAFRRARRSTHLPQVPARWGTGGDLGGTPHGAVRASWSRGQPRRRGARQPIGEVGGKGGGKDDAVGYDAAKKVKGRKIHALVDTEGLPMRVVVHYAAVQDRDGPRSSSTRYAAASPGSN